MDSIPVDLSNELVETMPPDSCLVDWMPVVVGCELAEVIVADSWVVVDLTSADVVDAIGVVPNS